MQRQGDHLSEYLTAVLDKDAERARSVVLSKLQEHRSLAEAFEFIAKAQFRIGELWEQNVIGIADEHFATDLALQLIREVSEKGRSFRRGSSGTALLCCVEGEYHFVGLAMLAELLRDAGLDAQLLGPDQSFSSILDAIKKSGARVDLICLSVTMPFNMSNLVKTLKLIRGEPALKEVPVIVGGTLPKSYKTNGLLHDANDNARLADYVASDLIDALKHAAGLLERKSSQASG
ncbi:MAG: cobalamin-dependent protein [Nitrososphaerales archaeon]|jgi:methanogenic corrinoid protein MtbC1